MPKNRLIISISLPDEAINIITNKVLPTTDGWNFFNDISFGLVTLEKGLHVLRITVADAGFYLDKIQFIIESSVGNKNVKENESTIHPNPSYNGKFNLSESQKWEIYSINGNKVLEGDDLIINLSKNAKGLYLLKTQTKTVKLVVN